MTMMTTVTTIPATDNPIDALPSRLALPGSDTAVLLATTAHTYIPHTMMLYLHQEGRVYVLINCFFLFFFRQEYSKNESSAVARKPPDVAAVLFGLKFANNIRR